MRCKKKKAARIYLDFVPEARAVVYGMTLLRWAENDAKPSAYLDVMSDTSKCC